MFIRDLLFPSYCFLCKQLSDRKQDLCSFCLQSLPIVPHQCAICAQKLAAANANICGSCLTCPPPFHRTYALFAYEPPINWLIHHLKFKSQLILAKIFGQLLLEKIKTCENFPDTIIPVPLHLQRLKERGFNQALEIARPIAKTLNIPIDFKSAQRIKNTVAQASLPSERRRQNIKDAFSILGNWSGKRVALVDDVVTTGATITALSEALIEKEVESITIWCVARA